MPAAVNHFKKTKKIRSPPVSPFSSPLASPSATDPGFPRPQIRAARGGRTGAAGRVPASLEKPAGHVDATAGPPPPRQSLAGDHADASSRIPPRRGGGRPPRRRVLARRGGGPSVVAVVDPGVMAVVEIHRRIRSLHRQIRGGGGRRRRIHGGRGRRRRIWREEEGGVREMERGRGRWRGRGR